TGAPSPSWQRRSDKGKPGESRGHKATGPRFLRDAAALTPRRTHDRRATAPVAWRSLFREAKGASSDEEPQWQADERGRLPGRAGAGAREAVRGRRRRAVAGGAAPRQLAWRHHSLPDERRGRRTHHARLPDGAGVAGRRARGAE